MRLLWIVLKRDIIKKDIDPHCNSIKTNKKFFSTRSNNMKDIDVNCNSKKMKKLLPPNLILLEILIL